MIEQEKQKTKQNKTKGGFKGVYEGEGKDEIERKGGIVSLHIHLSLILFGLP